MILYSVLLDNFPDLAATVVRLLAAHCQAIGTRRRTRALTPWVQAMLMLRFFRDATRIKALACDNTVALSTA